MVGETRGTSGQVLWWPIQRNLKERGEPDDIEKMPLELDWKVTGTVAAPQSITVDMNLLRSPLIDPFSFLERFI
jgi:hypothetical protein